MQHLERKLQRLRRTDSRGFRIDTRPQEQHDDTHHRDDPCDGSDVLSDLSQVAERLTRLLNDLAKS
jgi:hypothetical protein